MIGSLRRGERMPRRLAARSAADARLLVGTVVVAARRRRSPSSPAERGRLRLDRPGARRALRPGRPAAGDRGALGGRREPRAAARAPRTSPWAPRSTPASTASSRLRVERAAEAERAGRAPALPAARLARAGGPPRVGVRPAGPGTADPVLLAQIESPRASSGPRRSRPSRASTRSSSAARTSRSTWARTRSAARRAARGDRARPARRRGRRASPPGVAGPGRPGRCSRELAGERSSVLVLGADVRIYARALRGGVGRLRTKRRSEAPRTGGGHVGT